MSHAGEKDDAASKTIRLCETVYRLSESKDLPTAHWGCMGVVKSLVLTDFWQIQRIYAIILMSETVSIDIHEIESICVEEMFGFNRRWVFIYHCGVVINGIFHLVLSLINH